MTATLISLISIFVGILGANIASLYLKNYSFGIVGNTMAGVFGSIFFIKSFGRLGFDPISIIKSGNIDYNLFIINLIVSLIGGIAAMILAKKIKELMNTKK